MKHLSKKSAVIISILLIAGVSVAALELSGTTNLFGSKARSSTESGIDYGPPTEVEKQDAESHKDTLPETNEKTDDSKEIESKKQARVEISTWAQKTSTLDVNGFIANLVEESGTCELTLIYETDPSQKITQSRPAEANASTTTCGVISVPLSKLQPGTWNAVLNYTSSTASGKSEVTPLEVE